MFIPDKGQWVQVLLEEGPAKQAEQAGAWRTRSNRFCGIYAGESRTPEGVVVLPARIMLVNEKGDNIRSLLSTWQVKDLWVFAPHEVPEGVGATLAPDHPFASQGCIGAVTEVIPVDEKEDCPPGRRPDYHPRDIRKPRVNPHPPLHEMPLDRLKQLVAQREAEEQERAAAASVQPQPQEPKAS